LYFRPFRTELLKAMTLRRIHVFESREDAFRDDDVLQENVILNSPKAVYQIEAGALEVLRTVGSKEWDKALRTYLTSVETLKKRYAREREMKRIPLMLAGGKEITLSPGGQNVLVKEIVDQFCPRFTPGGQPIYVGDTDEKWAYFDKELLRKLGVEVDSHGKMPDVVIYFEEQGWLVLIEAVTSHGPVNAKRRGELATLFKGCKAGLVYVTAFLTRRAMGRTPGSRTSRP
jgi:hypothetical protein